MPPEEVYCTQCGEPITSEANYCPHCGSKQEVPHETGAGNSIPGISPEKSTRRNLLAATGYSILGLLGLGAIVTVLDASDNKANPYPNAWYYDRETGIVLRDVEGVAGQYAVRIRGLAINRSNQDYSYVGISFAIYDDSETKVGDALANTSGLEADQRWRFEAIGTDTAFADQFGIEEITAY